MIQREGHAVQALDGGRLLVVTLEFGLVVAR